MPRSPSAPTPSRARARGSRARTGPRSAPAAARCRTARPTARRDWARARLTLSWQRGPCVRPCQRVNRPLMRELPGHIGRAHGAVVAERHQHRQRLATDCARRLRNASSGVAFGSSTTMSASCPGASVPMRSSSASARAPPSVARKNASTASIGGFAAAPPCRLRPWSRAARSWCRRRCRCRGRRATGRRGSRASRRRNRPLPRNRFEVGQCASAVPLAWQRQNCALVEMHAMRQHRAPADQPVMGVDVEIVAPLGKSSFTQAISRGSPRCGSA